jgi:hypothetical protein
MAKIRVYFPVLAGVEVPTHSIDFSCLDEAAEAIAGVLRDLSPEGEEPLLTRCGREGPQGQGTSKMALAYAVGTVAAIKNQA